MQRKRASRPSRKPAKENTRGNRLSGSGVVCASGAEGQESTQGILPRFFHGDAKRKNRIKSDGSSSTLRLVPDSSTGASTFSQPGSSSVSSKVCSTSPAPVSCQERITLPWAKVALRRCGWKDDEKPVDCVSAEASSPTVRLNVPCPIEPMGGVDSHCRTMSGPS